MTVLLFVVGLVCLIAGAETLVRGASRLAAMFGIPPIVIGLTVVAFGTSSPELAVSIKSSLSGQAGVALGNVVGSNIFNVLFILGISAIIIPLTVDRQLLRLDVPVMVVMSIVVLLLSLDQALSRADGLLLVTVLFSYIGFLIYQSRKNHAQLAAEMPEAQTVPAAGNAGWLMNLVLIVIGLALLVAGSRWLVDSAVAFAQYLGVSELVIGLTIIAAGTSLPEVVTSIIAAVRGERDIAVGNVIGSNIFNILGVLGFAGIVAPGGIPVPASVVGFDFPVMIAVALACLPVFFSGGVIDRKEGVLFLGYYVIYTLYLILNTSGHDALPLFNGVMLYFVIPFTVLVLVNITLQETRKRKRQE
ncbi:MAG: calcium/sodium antiporter [Ketobacteraceae bacterium]|nr:calcium/sodium antiporter [Ketobacteraceae bacterium]